MILQANGIQRKANVTILISDEVDFKIKELSRQRKTLHKNKGNHTPRRHHTYQYLWPQSESPKIYKTTTNRTKEKNWPKNTILVEYPNTQLTTMDVSPKQKMNKDMSALNDRLEQWDIIDIYLQSLSS